MFKIKAEYTEQVEVKTTLEKAREFFGEMRNFVELMPGIENITRDANGIIRWMVRADLPVIGSMCAAFAVEQTENEPERIAWSPASSERMNYLRYAAAFEQRGKSTLVRIVQKVEMRRPKPRDLHILAGLVGESVISSEMQKRVTEMIKTFMQRSREILERGD